MDTILLVHYGLASIIFGIVTYIIMLQAEDEKWVESLITTALGTIILLSIAESAQPYMDAYILKNSKGD